MAVIFYLQVEIASSFLKAYSFAAMFSGILIIHAFSKEVWIKRLSNSLVFIIVFLFWVGIVSAYTQQIIWLACVYAFTLQLSDYLVSQGGNSRLISVYRSVLILSVVPAFMGLHFYEEVMVPIRILFCLVFIFASYKICQVFKPLDITNAAIYIVGTHISYFGSLAVIAWSAEGGAVKAWYVGCQLGQSILLKIYDFQIRGSALMRFKGSLDKPAVYLILGTMALPLYFWSPNEMAFLAYLTGLLGLRLTSLFSRNK